MPSRDWSSFTFVGAVMFLIASSLSAAEEIPSELSVYPKKLTFGCLNSIFSGFSFTLLALLASSISANEITSRSE